MSIVIAAMLPNQYEAWTTLLVEPQSISKGLIEPTLEESLYWRGLALEATGDLGSAIADLQEAVRLNPNFEAGLFQLNRMLGGN